MDKNTLRKQMISKLKKISLKERLLIESKLHTHLFHSLLWKKSSIIGTTWSHSFEWNTYPIIEKAWQENKIVCLPVSEAKTRQMRFYQINQYSHLINGYAQIKEPDVTKEIPIKKNDIALLIVPGIVFDHRGYRIGFGGGYYDRFLTDYPGDTVSLLSGKQLVPLVPVDPYDIPVNHLITENGWT